MTTRSLDLHSLRAAYADGSVTAEAVMADVLARIAAAGDDAVWISQVPDAVAVTGPALFQAQHRLAALRRQTEAVWQSVDLLLLPTTGTAYSLQQIEAEPVLRSVGIPDPERRARAFPFELSGVMCQRVVIAVAARPVLLIADEPTTGLDVTTQATVMDLLARLAAENGMATLLITHDLALASERAGRIAVMHAGHVVEDAPTATLLVHPRPPTPAACCPRRPPALARCLICTRLPVTCRTSGAMTCRLAGTQPAANGTFRRATRH